jgi:hypothetical protein
LKITFRLWFFKYTINIPLVKIDKESSEIVVKQDTYAGDSKTEQLNSKKKFTPKEILNTFENTKELIQHVVDFHRIIRKFLKKISIIKFEWHSNFGIGDAALTGMFVGAGWSLKGGILGLLSQYMRFKVRPTVTITPFFQQKFSHTKLTCMISFRIGYAILAGLRIVKFWKGGRPSFSPSDPSFFKPKNNGKTIV